MVNAGFEGRFNTQPPEGGWNWPISQAWASVVSTHSRLKAAGKAHVVEAEGFDVSTHSRLKAAGDNVYYSDEG